MVSSGERFVETTQNMGGDLFFQHVGRYLFAKANVSGRVVLDAACGSGYGSDILSQKAKQVVGIDISWEAIQQCKARFHKTNLCFLQMDCNTLAFPAFFFDVIIFLY